jgi:hypothetical protein
LTKYQFKQKAEELALEIFVIMNNAKTQCEKLECLTEIKPIGDQLRNLAHEQLENFNTGIYVSQVLEKARYARTLFIRKNFDPDYKKWR